jgi:hypothetical protein
VVLVVTGLLAGGRLPVHAGCVLAGRVAGSDHLPHLSHQAATQTTCAPHHRGANMTPQAASPDASQAV